MVKQQQPECPICKARTNSPHSPNREEERASQVEIDDRLRERGIR